MEFGILSKHNQLVDTTINLTKREIKTRYTESFLGPLWIIIYPLAFTLITVVIFSFVFHGNIEKMPYFLYVLVGFNAWFWFSQTVIYSTRSLIGNRDLILNNKFPTESIVLSIALSRVIDYLINTLIIYIIFILFHQKIYFFGFLFFLFTSFIQFIFQLGISFLCAAGNVRFRDLQNLIDIFLQLFFYATPIIYSLGIVSGQLRLLILVNPMTQIIISYRESLTNNNFPIEKSIILLTISLIVIIFGYKIFKKTEYKFAELI